jgi:putative acetyltransferase
VSPDRQRSGIGGALVRAVTALADSRGEPLVIVEGSPNYYARFGFEDARPHGLLVPLPDWAPREAGQVLLLTAYDPDDPTLRGDVVYPPAFDDID